MAATVMVVDDAQMVRQQVGHALTGAGFSVVEAVDGVDALAKLSSGAPDIAVVILDLNMPRMNGIEFLEALSAQTGRPLCPVLMLTTEGQPDLMRRAKELGARGWIVKPFRPQALVAAVTKLAADKAV